MAMPSVKLDSVPGVRRVLGIMSVVREHMGRKEINELIAYLQFKACRRRELIHRDLKALVGDYLGGRRSSVAMKHLHSGHLFFSLISSTELRFIHFEA